MRKLACLLLAVCYSFFLTSPIFADEVILKNGDRLSGRILSHDDESIVLETSYAGPVKIDPDFVDKITLLASGDRAAAITVVRESAKLEETGSVKPIRNAETGLKPVPKLFGGRFYGAADGWSGNANIGFSYTSGNSATATMTTGIRAVKTGSDDKLTVYFRSHWNKNRKLSDNATTTNAYWGGARYDRDINDRMFGYGSFDFERDHPKKLNFRSVAGAGFGHHTVKNDRTELDVMLGGAWNHTWQQGPNTDSPEATAGNVLKHKITDRLKIQESFAFFQNITDKSEFRYMLDTTLSADVTKKIGWFVTIGNRFNNDPISDSEKNDVLFTTGIKWNFGGKK